MASGPDAYLVLFLARRGRAVIVVEDVHVLRAQENRRATDAEIELTVRQGRLRRRKCRAFARRSYDKICLYRYFGKARRTIEVVLLYDREFDTIEVRTVWTHRGRKEGEGSRG